MKKFYASIALAFAMVASATFSLRADAPVSYYKPIEGKAQADLKTALSAVIVYTPTKDTEEVYNALNKTFKQTDVRPALDKNGNQIYENGQAVWYWWDMYSNLDVNINWTFGRYMNREHSFPKSWWGGLKNIPAYCDLNLLYPGEAEANVTKSNWPLGIAANNNYFDNGVTIVSNPRTGTGGGAKYVFEPADEYKGDFARAYFYVVTRYQDLIWNKSYCWMLIPPTESKDANGKTVYTPNTYPTLQNWAIDLLLQWNEQDPVSQKEIDRNNRVWDIQHNRNPFIDYPILAEYIWGSKKGEKFYLNSDLPGGEPILEEPVHGSSIDFSEVAVGNTVVQNLNFVGENLNGSIELTLYGKDAKMFSIPSTTIKASAINATGGYKLPITYKPTEAGEHKATLLITGPGVPATGRGIDLIGEAFPVPTLSKLVATDPSDITDDSYVANWDKEPVTEVVDYYVVTRTKYNNGKSTSEDIMAESNSLEITGFSASESESYHVRSARLGYFSTPSNEVYVDHAGIQGVEADIPMGWAAAEGGILILTGETLYDVAVYDIAGRLIRVIPTVDNGQTINLPLGVYLIQSGNTTLRVLVNM